MKKSYLNINLTCSFQQAEEPTENQCISGLFSKNTDGSFSFEEIIPKVRDVRNAKLFDGHYISMVRMKNGKLQFHMKTLEPGFDANELISAICSEFSSALSHIQ